MARQRRQRQLEDMHNQDRWLISYADFITLLFAFFVVMYAISSVNAGKYRVLSDAMEIAFQIKSGIDPVVVQGGAESGVGSGPMEGSKDVLEMLPSSIEPQPALDRLNRNDAADTQDVLERLAGGVEQSLAAHIDKDLISVHRDKAWLEIELKSNLLFESGSARLSRDAVPLLRNISNLLWAYPNPVNVEGFTDNVPIDTEEFPSNWELSAARAASVVHLFTKFGMNPKRLAATGYGEYQPKVSNDTDAGRQANRRVVLVVLANGRARNGQGLELRNATTEKQ